MSTQKPSASVIFAAILAILGSLFTMLCVGLGAMGLYLSPATKTGTDVPGLPPFALAAVGIALVVMFIVAVFGVFTGIGLYQLKNWARISALVWAGIIVVFGSTALVTIMALPFPPVPNTQGVNMAVVKGLLAVFYGLPIVIGAWWLILFNQKRTKALFTGTSVLSSADIPEKARCPIPVAVIAGFMLFSVAGMFLVPLMHLPVGLILFGQRVRGELGAFLFAASAVLYLAAAIGLLTLKRWGYWLAIGLYGFWMLSGAVTFLRGTFVQNMQEMMSEMHLPETSTNTMPMLSNRFFAIAALTPALLILGILLYYRSRFMKAAADAESSV